MCPDKDQQYPDPHVEANGFSADHPAPNDPKKDFDLDSFLRDNDFMSKTGSIRMPSSQSAPKATSTRVEKPVHSGLTEQPERAGQTEKAAEKAAEKPEGASPDEQAAESTGPAKKAAESADPAEKAAEKTAEKTASKPEGSGQVEKPAEKASSARPTEKTQASQPAEKTAASSSSKKTSAADSADKAAALPAAPKAEASSPAQKTAALGQAAKDREKPTDSGTQTDTGTQTDSSPRTNVGSRTGPSTRTGTSAGTRKSPSAGQRTGTSARPPGSTGATGKDSVRPTSPQRSPEASSTERPALQTSPSERVAAAAAAAREAQERKATRLMRDKENVPEQVPEATKKRPEEPRIADQRSLRNARPGIDDPSSSRRRLSSDQPSKRAAFAPTERQRTSPVRRDAAKPDTQRNMPARDFRGQRAKARGTLATAAANNASTNNASYKSSSMSDNDYHIRGGGFTQGRSRRMLGLLGLITAVALVLSVFGIVKLVGYLSSARVDNSIITITNDQAHSAISASMPHLLDFISSDADSAFTSLSNSGLRVYLNDRETSDNPDNTATGKEIVFLPSAATDDMLQTYNGSEFNDFTFDQLQNEMLGSWMMDISKGDKGTYIQFKYVNLAATSLTDEMQWLLAQQGLSGGNNQVLDQGTDDFGNSYIVGSLTDGSNVYYWRVISCSFGSYYQGSDTRKLPSGAAYVKLKIANWDFVDSASLQSGDATSSDATAADQSSSDATATDQSASDSTAADQSSSDATATDQSASGSTATDQSASGSTATTN